MLNPSKMVKNQQNMVNLSLKVHSKKEVKKTNYGFKKNGQNTPIKKPKCLMKKSRFNYIPK